MINSFGADFVGCLGYAKKKKEFLKMGNIKYVLMAIAICLSVFSSCLLRSFSDKKLTENSGDLFLFNAALSVVWTIVLGIWFLVSGESGASHTAYIFGAAYGVIMCAFLFTKTCLLGEGPVSLTTLIGSCAFIIATWFGVIYANEPSINLVQYIGMALLVVSLILCINPKKSGEKLTAKWFAYAFAFFIAGGFLGIINKMFGKSSASTEVNAMMLTASVVTAILFALVGILFNKACGKSMPKIRKGAWVYILVCGVASCLYQRLNVSLAKEILSVIFFPVSNGSMVLLSTLMGRLIFKENLRPMQIFGIIIGLIAIIMIGCSSLIYGLFGM